MSNAVAEHVRTLEEVANSNFRGKPDPAYKGKDQRLMGYANPRFGTPALVNRGMIEVGSVPYLGPFNIPIMSARQAVYQEGRYDLFNSEDAASFSQLVKEAFTPGPKQAASYFELNAYRSFVMSMAFPAQPFALSAFQTVDLAMDELVMLEFPSSPHANGFTVRSHAFPGLPFIANWTAKSQVEYLDMGYISTDRVQYRLYDLQVGEVSEADRIREQLEVDLDLHIDSMALAEIDAAIMTSGLRDTIDLHPLLNPNNVPDVNYLDLSANDPGYITLDKLKTILAHIVLLNSLGGQRAVRPTAWVLSPQHITDTWEFVDLVSGFEAVVPNPLIEDPRNTIPTSVRDQIFKTGMMTNAWGMTINWQPNSQLDRGRIYIFMDQPLGWQFTKSSMDRQYTFDDTNSYKHAIDNYGEMFMKRALRFVVPDMWKYRLLVVDL